MPVTHPYRTLVEYNARRGRAEYRARMSDEQHIADLPPSFIDVEWRSKFELDRAKGKKPKVTLSDAVNRYCETILPIRHVPARVRQVRNVLYRMTDHLGPNVSVHRINEQHLSRCRDALVADGYKTSTVNRYMQCVQSVLNTCRDNWLILSKVPRLRNMKDVRGFRYLNEEEETRLLAHSVPRLQRLIKFILGTGARKSEALHLTWDDVQEVTEQRRMWVRFTMTKNGRPHAVPLPRSVEEMILEMKRERTSNLKYVFTTIPKRDRRTPDGRLFSKKGVPAHYLWPDEDFRRACRNADLTGVTIHSLRHTYASRLIMKGVPLFDVSKLLNHRNFDSTMIYAHMDTAHLETSMQLMDQPRRITIGRDNTGQYTLGL